MTFFKPPAPSPKPLPPYTPPPRSAARGDRAAVARVTEDVPDFRKPAPTLENKGKWGLTNNRVLERIPRGVLFKVVKYGFFDLDGYWVTVKGGWAEGRDKEGRSYEYEVRRGAPRAINRLLTKEQRWELARVRLQARRKGVR